jgi:hypothetical protein
MSRDMLGLVLARASTSFLACIMRACAGLTKKLFLDAIKQLLEVQEKMLEPLRLKYMSRVQLLGLNQLKCSIFMGDVE